MCITLNVICSFSQKFEYEELFSHIDLSTMCIVCAFSVFRLSILKPQNIHSSYTEYIQKIHRVYIEYVQNLPFDKRNWYFLL